MGLRDYTLIESTNIQFGRLGSTLIKTTNPITGNYAIIQVIADATSLLAYISETKNIR